LIATTLAANASWLHAVNPFVIAADARPRVAGGKLITDAFDDSTSTLVQNVRTFGWQFQSIPGDPYFIQDPGFNAVAGSGLQGGSFIGFNVSRGLSFFSGSEPVDLGQIPVGFGQTPAGESLSFSFGAGTVGISSTTAAQPGFNFSSVAANGSLHRHLNANLNPGTLATPSKGIYFTSIRLTNTAGAAPSDALFLLFNNGAAPADFSRALDYVANPFAGDADFSGSVTLDDFTALAANFGSPGEQFWYDGDFNDDYQVNLDDFTALAANFGLAAPSGLPRDSAIPEPTSLTFALVVASQLFLRRRTRVSSSLQEV